MRCLGPAILDRFQQKLLDAGKTITVERDRVFPDAAEKAAPGDLWWVKEPCFEVTAHLNGVGQSHTCIVPGNLLTLKYPSHLPKNTAAQMRHISRPASMVRRSESRAYLKIVTISNLGFHCTSHMQNIDDFLSGKAVAA